MNEIELYKDVCDGRFSRMESKLDTLDSKFDTKLEGLDKKVDSKFKNLDSKFNALGQHLDSKHDALLERIEPLNNFKYKVIGAVSVITLVISIVVSYSIATKKAMGDQQTKVSKTKSNI